MTIVGILGTVPWRRESCLRTLGSIERQTCKLDALLIVRDGAQAPFGVAAATTVQETEVEPARGSWNRIVLGWQFAKEHGASHVAVLDDDLEFSPKYLEGMIAACIRLGGPVALGGTDRMWIYQNYWTRLTADRPLVEPNIGVSLWPTDIDLPALVAAIPIAQKIVHDAGDLVVSLALWMQGRHVVQPAHDFTATPDPSWMDPRSLFVSRGGSEQVWRMRQEVQRATGWPGVPLP